MYQPESDIDIEEEETLITWAIMDKCAECGHVEPATICMESIEDYKKNEDGTYTDIFSLPCSACVEKEAHS